MPRQSNYRTVMYEGIIRTSNDAVFTEMRVSGDQHIQSTNSHQDRLIEVLVQRLMGRLPHRSGDTGLATLETDDHGLRKTIASLQELCRHKLPYVIHLLQAELEMVIKMPSTNQYHHTPVSQYSDFGETGATLDNLRSQMFIAQIIAACLNWYWNCFRQTEEEQSNPLPAADLPPLDDRTAKQLLVTVAFLLKQDMVHSGSTEVLRGSASPAQNSVRSFSDTNPDTPSSFHRRRQSTRQSRLSTSHSPPFPAVDVHNAPAVMQDILKSAASIAAFISASRWDVMLVKLRNLLAYYSSSEEYTDLSEVGLFEFCSLNEYRFSSMIGELSMFGNLKRSAQAALCTTLHRAIWKFLAANPLIMSTMYEEQRRTAFSGQPEALFDSVFASTDSSKRKAHTWPLLAILLPFCPEIVTKLVMAGGGVDTRSPLFAKKIHFLDGLRKTVRTQASEAKGGDLSLALACYADLCHAASYTATSSAGQPTGLRILVSDMEMEIRTRVFDLARRSIAPDGNVDTDLMIQALVALSKIHFSHVKADILPRLLAKSANLEYKTVGLAACTVLLNEGQVLSWHPSTLDIVMAISNPVKMLLQDVVTSTFGIDAAGQPTISPDPQSRHLFENEQSPRNAILQLVIRLLEAEPGVLFLRGDTDSLASQNDESVDDSFWSASQMLRYQSDCPVQGIALLCCLGEDSNPPSIRQATFNLLLQLHTYSVNQVDPSMHYHHPGPAMSRCEIPLAAVFTRSILQSQQDTEEQKLALQMATTWLKQRVQTSAAYEIQSLSCQAVTAVCELAGLVSLCSVDEEVHRATVPFFQTLQRLAELRHVGSTNVVAIAKSLTREEGPGLGGIIAQAKRLLQVFKAVSEPSTGLRAAWLEMHRTWTKMAARFGVAGYEEEIGLEPSSRGVGLDIHVLQPAPVTEEDVIQWIHTSGFLVQTLGIYTNTPKQNYLANFLLAGHLPVRFLEEKPLQRVAARCLKDMVNLLWSEYPRMRDATRELLGGDLSPAFLPSLVGQLHLAAESYVEYGRFETASEEVTLFFDQSLAVLSRTFSRIPDSQEIAPTTISQLESLLLAGAYYGNRQELSAVSTRLKIQLCRATVSLFSSAVGRRKLLSLDFRNTLAGYLLVYAEEASFSEPEKLRQEMQLQAVQAMALCFEGLPVRRVSDKPSSKLEAPDARLLNGYIDRLLVIAGSLDNNERDEQTHKRNISSTSRIDAATSASESVLAGIVEAAANLLVANLPTSCSRLTTLATPHGSRLEKDIVASVVEKWSENFDLQSLSLPDPYSDLIEAICAPDLELALAIVELCPGAEQEGLLDLLMSLLNSRGLSTELLKAIVTKEINDTDHESTLFRGNTTASRLLTVFARCKGYSYTRFLISNLMSPLTKQPLGLSEFDIYLEADPDDEGLLKLEALAEAFFQLICDTWWYIPTEIRDVCHHIQAAVRSRFPDSVYTAIGGWIFLRFINPVIISPDLVDVELPEDSKETRRALVLITKLLQALSNNIRFKEAGMKTLNAFVEKHILDMTTFLGQISAPLQASEIESEVLDRPACGLSEFDKRTLFHFIWTNTERIGSILLTRTAGDQAKRPHNGSERSSFDMPNTNWGALTDILWKIRQEGEAIEDRHPVARPRLLSDLVSTDPTPSSSARAWDNMLRTGFFARDGTLGVCLVLHRLDTSETDFDGLMRYSLMWLSKISGPFDLILDSWGYQNENAIPYEWLQLFASLLPEGTAARLRNIYLYSPSTSFVRDLRKLACALPFVSLEKKIKVLNSVKELEDEFPSPAAVLPSRSIEMASEEVSAGGAATHSSEDDHPHPSMLYLGQSTLQIVTSRKRPLVGDLKCITREVIWLRQIDSVRPPHTLYASSDVELLLTSGRRIKLQETDDAPHFIQHLQASTLSGVGANTLRSTSCSGIATSKEDVVALLLSTSLWHCASGEAVQRRHGFSLLQKTIHNFSLDFDEMHSLTATPSALATMTALPDFFDKISETHLDLTGDFVLRALQECRDGSTLQALRVIPSIKPWFSNLSAYACSENVAAHNRVREIMHALIDLTLKDEVIHCFLQSRIWPTVFKAEGLLDLVIEELCSTLTRCDISENQKKLTASIATFGSSCVAIRGRSNAHLRMLIDIAGVTEAPSLDQAKEWQDIQALLFIDAGLAASDGVSSQIYAPEIVFVVVFLAGLGDDEARARLEQIAIYFLQQMPKEQSIPSGIWKLEEVAKLQKALQQVATTLQVNKIEPTQDSGRLSAVDCIDEVASIMVQSLTQGAPSEDTLNAWKARCASLICGYILRSEILLQTRSLLLLSHLDPDNHTIAVLIRTLQANLEDNMNSNALQAYLLCFTRFMQGTSNADLAAQLFWLAIGTSQAHPLLFSFAINLLDASVRCIAKHGLTGNDSLHAFLIKARQGNGSLEVATSNLDKAIEADITASNFSFAMAALLSKGLRQPSTVTATAGLLKTLAVLGVDGPAPQANGSSEHNHALVDNLGYLVPLLTVAATTADEVCMEDLLQIAGIEQQAVDLATPYQPLLANVDFERNEPLVLAASLAMSLLHTAQSTKERTILVSFLHEIADLSTSVVLLLENHILPSLSLWLKTSDDPDLISAAHNLLAILLAAPSDTQQGTLEISTYVTALGFPNLLECASYATFVENITASPEQTRYRLRCCADLLGAFPRTA